MTRFIVHIGPHKTGTTYLQAVLHTMRDALHPHGVHIPAIWNAAPDVPSHMKLVRSIREGDLGTVQAQIADMLANRYEYVVISCEALSRLEPAHIIQLRALLGSAPVTIVYYVRRATERLPSLWQERVKHGYHETLTEFLADHLSRKDKSELWDSLMIDRYRDVFGVTNIALISYSFLTDSSIDIARHFFSAMLALSDFEFPPEAHLNVALSDFDVELIRALNAVHRLRGGDMSPEVRAWFTDRREQFDLAPVLSAMCQSTCALVLDETVQPFRTVSQALFAAYGSSLVPPTVKSAFHTPRAIELRYICQNYLLDPAVLARLHEIYRAYPDAR